jgi:O-antigen/teichoic acid export membrane protein
MTTTAQALTTSQTRGKPLRRSFAWVLSGNGFYALCQWGLFIEVARLGTPAMLGKLALAFAITAPIFMLTNLQLSSVLASDCAHEFAFGTYLTARLIGTTLALFCVAVVVISGRFDRTTCFVIIAITAAKSAESLSDMIYGLWQKYELFDEVARALTIRASGSLVICGLALQMRHSIITATLCLAGYWIFCLFTHDMRRMKEIRARHAQTEVSNQGCTWPSLKALFALSWPCGIITLLLAISVNMPRYFIRHSLGDAALGVFAAVACLPLAVGLIASSIGQAALPRLSQYCRSDSRRFALLVQKAIAISLLFNLGAVVIAVLSGPKVLNFIYAGRYAQYSSVLVWLMLAAAPSFTSSILGYFLTAARRFRPQVVLLTLVAILTALICWRAVPHFGLIGAALAILIGNFTTAIGTVVILRRALMSGPEAV